MSSLKSNSGATPIRCTVLASRPDNWDALIKDHHTRTVFHQSAWLDYLVSICPKGQMDFVSIEQRGKVIGYLPLLTVRPVPFLKVAGSSLPLTGAREMGPIVNLDVDQKELLHGIMNLCSSQKINHLELSTQCLQPELMRQAGFQVYRSLTCRLPLPKTVEQAWSAIKSIGRNRIRKAERSGFTVEQVESRDFIDEFYSQFTASFAERKQVVPYSRDRLEQMYRHLAPVGNFLGLMLKHQGKPVASGYFLLDDRTMYLGDYAWRPETLSLCPNELLHWTAIKIAIERGIPVFDSAGSNRFWEKFNAIEVPTYRFSRSFGPFLRMARNVYGYLLRQPSAAVVLSTRSPFAARPTA
ncbi:MAG: GNAT family N-acetyltransferase [Acidobacteria bacterium]|nr:GNAT family N-acetyltransferase [Acidobacteriota bacterium]